MELTPEGLELRSRATEAIALVDRIKREFVERDEGELTGVVRIGAAETAGMKTVTSVTAHLRGAHPKVHLHLSTGDETAIACLEARKDPSDTARCFLELMKERLAHD